MNRTARLPQRAASPSSALGPSEAERAKTGPPPGAHAIGAVSIERTAPDRLPAHVAAGIRALSGISLGDVRVRYRSAEPSRVQAAAFTRGNEIHVAPGAEHHLAHEAWHVVQQRRGSVRATSRTSTGQPLNDDPRLEREAEVMGSRAVARGRSE